MPRSATRRAGEAAKIKFLDRYLPYLLGHASFAMNKDFDRYVGLSGISPLEWRVLATLCDDEALTIGDLARKVVAQQPTLTKAIKRMAEAGLVRRGSDDADLRRTMVSVTPVGRALAEKLIRRALEHEEQWLKGVTKEDAEIVRRVLQLIIERRRSPLPYLDDQP
jgi:DNA-binding MarR family transcriptional regulator